MAQDLKIYKSIEDLPAHLPVFPLPGALLLPRAQLPLNIFEPRYLEMVDAALSGNRLIGMIQPLPEDESKSDKSDLYEVGCAGRLTSYAETEDGRYMIVLTGVCRFRVLEEMEAATLFRQVQADFGTFEEDLAEEEKNGRVDREAVLEVFKNYLDAHNMQADWDEVSATGNEMLINTLAMLSPYEVREKQALLEAASIGERADILIALTEMKLAQQNSPDGTRLQ